MEMGVLRGSSPTAWGSLGRIIVYNDSLADLDQYDIIIILGVQKLSRKALELCLETSLSDLFSPTFVILMDVCYSNYL